MYQEKTFLAIIPARGGSKRLPGKNVRPIAGKPMIVWSIEAALKCKYIDMLLVTSDDQEILDLAHDHGAECLQRPLYLSTDEAGTADVIMHAVDSLSRKYDYIVLMQPTSPLRTAAHVEEAIEELVRKSSDSIVSVTKTEHSPLWSNVLPSDGSMKEFLRKDIVGKRSQDLDTYYRLNGALYIIETKKFLATKSLFSEKSYAYVMPEEVSVDIDTIYDFIYAEAIIKHHLSSDK